MTEKVLDICVRKVKSKKVEGRGNYEGKKIMLDRRGFIGEGRRGEKKRRARKIPR